MAPVRGIRPALVAALLALFLLPAPARALRLVSYNLLNYPGNSGATRDPHFRTVLGPLGADVIAVQEMQSQAGVNEFRDQVLNTLEPGQWAAAPFVDYSTDTERALFYKPAQLTFLGGWGFFPNPAQPLRVVNVYRLRPVGYGSAAAEIRIYNMHLKASDSASDRAQRLAEVTGLRDSMNAAPPGTHLIALGDMNFYRGSDELAYWKFLESQADNDGRVYDPLNPGSVVQNWHDNSGFAAIHTQSPCLSGGCASGAATGGLDDRFDFFLPGLAWKDGEGLELLPSTYVSVGNDGAHFNTAITSAPTIPEGASYASALILAADHLPQRVDLQLPAKVSASGSPIALGSAIVGGAVAQDLTVSNSAAAPADTLEYGYAPPAGFTAPAGTITLLAGGSSLDAIGLDTSSPGAFGGNLLLNSNDLDTPSLAIPVSGTVLDHAVASLDSLGVLLADSIDFGVHDPGGFADQLLRIHNFDYDPLQAKLHAMFANLSGPDAARFEIVGGFSKTLVGVPAAGWNLHFDDAGVVPGTTYQATLTVTTHDEPLPGAAGQPDLTIALSATVASEATAIGDPRVPATTRLYAPFPNPLRGTGTVRFDLAREVADLRLEVFDLSGRRVATLAAGAHAPGSYSLRWNGANSEGRALGTGLYFLRLDGSGIPAAILRIAVVR